MIVLEADCDCSRERLRDIEELFLVTVRRSLTVAIDLVGEKCEPELLWVPVRGLVPPLTESVTLREPDRERVCS